MSKWNGWRLLTAAIVLLILCSQTMAWICEELDRGVTISILALKMIDTLAGFSLAALSWKTGASWAIHGSTRSSRVATWIAWLRQYERSSLASWWLLEIRQKNGWIMVRNFISSHPAVWLSHCTWARRMSVSLLGSILRSPRVFRCMMSQFDFRMSTISGILILFRATLLYFTFIKALILHDFIQNIPYLLKARLAAILIDSIQNLMCHTHLQTCQIWLKLLIFLFELIKFINLKCARLNWFVFKLLCLYIQDWIWCILDKERCHALIGGWMGRPALDSVCIVKASLGSHIESYWHIVRWQARVLKMLMTLIPHGVGILWHHVCCHASVGWGCRRGACVQLKVLQCVEAFETEIMRLPTVPVGARLPWNDLAWMNWRWYRISGSKDTELRVLQIKA